MLELQILWHAPNTGLSKWLWLDRYNETGNGNDNDNCKCTQIECISYKDFLSLFQSPKSYSWIGRVVVLPWWYWPCYLLGISHIISLVLQLILCQKIPHACNPPLSYAFVPPYRSLVFKECHLWLDMHWSSVLWVRKMFTFYIKQNLKMIFHVCSQTL